MTVYGGIDLHSTNSVVVLLDEKDRVLLEKRMPNDLDRVLFELSGHREEIAGIAVESTYNWYWLVDGLMDSGYRIHLANPSAMKQYEGKKYSDDRHDARWLAHLLRLGILPEGYIYPKEDRPVRDLLRKRSQLVQMRTKALLSMQNLFARNRGLRLGKDQINDLTAEEIEELLGHPDLALSMGSSLAVYECLSKEIQRLEKGVLSRVKPKKGFSLLRTVHGIGPILAMTILLETGPIERFPSVGDYASYCRCVDSRRISNGKKKGKGNTKNGNRHLGWAFVEAANYAIRFNERIRSFYQRKRSKRLPVVAIKAVAHKLARASYYILRDQVPFELNRAFA